MNTILVVDDDPDFRATLGEIVRSTGFKPTLASSGREALSLVSTNKFEIIILDMVMPGMDGLETLRELRRSAPQAKVIMVTAFSTIENAVAAIKLGASEYIAKPFHVNDFVSLLRRTQQEVKFERGVESLNLDAILGTLSNATRRTTIEMLSASGKLRLSDIKRALGISDHTKVLFHLRTMMESGIIQKSEDRYYVLTEKGRHVLSCLNEFSERLDSYA